MNNEFPRKSDRRKRQRWFLRGQRWRFAWVFVLIAVPSVNAQEGSVHDTAVGDKLLTNYFRAETEKLTDQAFADIRSIDDWNSRRETYRTQLFEMLGLSPLPKRAALNAKVVGFVDRDDVVVERLHFQSRPGLYVTANLYRPKKQTGPLPAVLYVCGHGRSTTDGISNGNKATYQHHGGWFARNGYVCLTIDTIQLGEFAGIHHGTYREKMWWWNNRGYTPAGVEAWNCIRALDYLETRPEVDKNRFGVTGRSGGGAYSWWIAALDDRIKVAVPVAGITSLRNHVVDGCVEGHCDCMYMVNTYRWDYPLVAALVAPRPLLISNTDKDRIFPIDGVVDVYSKVRKLYSMHDARDKLGLHITEGPHKDTQELRVHAFRWMNRWLRDDASLIDTVATPLFEPSELRVFDRLPNDEIVTKVHETFVPLADDTLPTTRAELNASTSKWMSALNNKVFRGWPSKGEIDELDIKMVRENESNGVSIQQFEFTSQHPYRLSFYAISATEKANRTGSLQISIVDQETWARSTAKRIESLMRGTASESASQKTEIIFAPRGIGPTQWNPSLRKQTQIRRRFMQLGQTAASMQIWDVRRLLQALDATGQFKDRRKVLCGKADTAMIVAYASLFDPGTHDLVLTDLPKSNRAAPDLLNISRFMTLQQVVMMAALKSGKTQLSLSGKQQDGWQAIASNELLREKLEIELDSETDAEH